MTNILVFGAGKSSSYLIKYLLDNSNQYFWQINVADANLNAALERIGNHSNGKAIQLDIFEETHRKKLIQEAKIIISLLPPALHIIVAKDCITLKKDLVTASYVSDEIKALDTDAKKNGLLLLNEMGLDPGIDHMSAMKIIHDIEKIGGDIYSFKSYCGGLISPESDNNPWHYKISWNADNVVNAGKSGADYLFDGNEKHIKYNTLFKDIEQIEVPNFGKLSAYANRDSLSYQSLYGLKNVKTMLRATLRYHDFCIGWHTIVNLGLTENEILYDTKNMTFHTWFMQASKDAKGDTPSEKIHTISGNNSIAKDLIEWLGIFSDSNIRLDKPSTSAQIMLHIIEEKWKMQPEDKDLIIMQHEFEYGRKNLNEKLFSTLIVEGENKTYTAMAKTVGLPMAIFTKLFLIGKIKNISGVQIPTLKEIYKPVLKELAENGIIFEDTLSS